MMEAHQVRAALVAQLHDGAKAIVERATKAPSDTFDERMEVSRKRRCAAFLVGLAGLVEVTDFEYRHHVEAVIPMIAYVDKQLAWEIAKLADQRPLMDAMTQPPPQFEEEG